MRLAALFGALVMMVAAPTPSLAQVSGRDLAKVDVCKLIPPAAIATAAGGALVKATPFNDGGGSSARCAYILSPAGAKPGVTSGHVIWLYPPAAFDQLREFTSAPLTKVAGVGDAAESFVDPGDGRFKLRVLVRGDVAMEVTGDDPATTRKVAEAALQAMLPARR